jgi:hypothetical protein
MSTRHRTPKEKLLYAQRQVLTYFQAVGVVVCNLRFQEAIDQMWSLVAMPDGTCFFDPAKIDLIPFNQLASMISHATFHTACQEEDRARWSHTEPWRFRLAFESFLHQILEDAGMPEIFGTSDFRNHDFDRISTEKAAKLIPDPPPGIDPSAFAIAACPVHLPLRRPKTPGEKGEESKDHGTAPPILTAALSHMNEFAKSIGQEFGGLKILLGKIFEPKIDWRTRLRFALSEVLGQQGRSYRRPSRRSGGISLSCGGNYIPFPGPNLGFEDVVFVIDLSGSVVGDKGLAESLFAEMGAILKLCRRACRVIFHESDVVDDFVTKNLKTVILRAAGGGGTDFVPVYELLAQCRKKIPLVVWLTDLCGGHIEARPPFPILWVTGETHGGVPWGRHIKIPVDRRDRDLDDALQ